jgi:hypothetical protein
MLGNIAMKYCPMFRAILIIHMLHARAMPALSACAHVLSLLALLAPRDSHFLPCWGIED